MLDVGLCMKVQHSFEHRKDGKGGAMRGTFSICLSLGLFVFLVCLFFLDTSTVEGPRRQIFHLGRSCQTTTSRLIWEI